MIELDDYVIDVLMPDLTGHDHSPASFIVFLQLWREAARGKGKAVAVSHQQMADLTGLSKSAVQVAIRHLLKRKLIARTSQNATSVPTYEIVRHWAKRRSAAS